MVAALKYLYAQSCLWKDGLMNGSPVVFALALLFLMVIPCSATQSQGLEWKYGEGTRYDFHETYYQGVNETLELTYDWTYYLIAPDCSEIADPLDPSQGIPVRRAVTYWPNGTEMRRSGPVSFAVPVGNWSLLSMIVENMSDPSSSFSAFQSDGIWGCEQQISVDFSTGIYSWEYSKSDGVIVRHTVNFTVLDYHQLITIERLASSLPLIQFGLTIVAATCIVLVILTYRKIKK
jgi:hypothetical protein